MMHSDDQVYSSDDEEFVTHTAAHKTRKTLPNLKSADNLVQKVWDIHESILKQARSKFAQKVMGFINQNGTDQKQQQKAPKSKDSITSLSLKKPKKLVLPICIRKSQLPYIEQFMETFIDKMTKVCNFDKDDSDCQDYQNLLKKSQKFGGITKFRKVNLFQKPDEGSMPQIALFIRKKIKQMALPDDMNIYYSTSITDLSPDNVYVIEEGLADLKCCLVVPTLKNFQQINSRSARFSCAEIIPIYLFEHRYLFRQLMYKCICDPEIKAYLPKESLKLIQDFDDFPLTFKEGTHRLAYCIHKLETLRERKNQKFKFVSIGLFLQVTKEAIDKTFNFYSYRQEMLKQYIACILDETQPFRLLDKYLNKGKDHQSMLKAMEINEDDLVKKLRQRLIRRFERKEQLKEFLHFFKDTETQKPTKKKSKKDSNTNLSEKIIFENQLYSAINYLTNEIRRQAKKFQWSQFDYEKQIKPMLPYYVFDSVVRQSATHKKIIQFIYDRFTVPLLSVIGKFCEDQDMDYGELMHYMKDLELLGLINITSNTLNPIVTPNFFDKASYLCRKMQ